mgnify:CR=1 FL=1
MTRTLQFCGLFLAVALLAGGCEAVVAADGTFTSLYDSYFGATCSGCHSPGNRAGKEGIESSLNFADKQSAYASLTGGSAAGLQGPAWDACNGAKFVVSGDPSKSLIVAVLDQATRNSFDLGNGGSCAGDSISDMTLKGGEPPAGFVTSLKAWITAGAPND